MNDDMHSISEKLSRGAELATEAMRLFTEAITDVFSGIFRLISDFAEQLNRPPLDKLAAISWARSERPNWYAIYCRTKKETHKKEIPGQNHSGI